MSEPFLGEIRMVAFDYAPRGFALCDGQLLDIASNSALFSLIGTTYGGDGRTTFALPDLRGRFPMHSGNGPGLSPRSHGEKGGEEIEIVDGRPPLIGWGEIKRVGENTVGGDPVTQGPYMPPYLSIRFIIAVQGIYPSRT